MSTAIEKKQSFAITERGTATRHPEHVVDLALRLIALNGGKVKITEEQLAAENISISRHTLATWRDFSFPQRYWQIRKDLSSEIGEDLAGKLTERALQADEAKAKYIEVALEKVDEVPAEHLAKNVASLATALASDIQMAQLLRDKPTKIQKIDVNAAISVLEKLGVVEKPDQAIDVEVIEE